MSPRERIPYSAVRTAAQNSTDRRLRRTGAANVSAKTAVRLLLRRERMSNTAVTLAGTRPIGKCSGSATRQRGQRKLHKSFGAGQSFWPALFATCPLLLKSSGHLILITVKTSFLLSVAADDLLVVGAFWTLPLHAAKMVVANLTTTKEDAICPMWPFWPHGGVKNHRVKLT